MSLQSLKDWFCNFLQPQCTTLSEGILKPFYRTICFFEKAICDQPNSVLQTSSSAKLILNKRPNCNVTHYLNYLFENTCSSTCNITLPKVLLSKQWMEQTTNDALSEVSCQGSNNEGLCHLAWCDVYNYLNFWWDRLYQHWCYTANCDNPGKMKFNFDKAVTIFEKGEPPCFKILRKWLGMQNPSYISIPYFAVVFFLTGGIFLIINLVMRKLKFRRRPSSSNATEPDQNLVQQLINSFGMARNSYNDLQLSLRETTENQQQLNAKLELQQQEIEVLRNEKLKNEESVGNLEYLARGLEQKCREYQNQVNNLLLADMNESKRMQAELDNLQSQLDLARVLHKREILKFHETIAQLLAKKKEETSENERRCEEYQQNGDVEEGPSGVLEDPGIEEPEKTQKENSYVTEALNKIKAIEEHTEELKTQIEEFNGTQEDQVFKHLNELLIRNTIKLDNVDTEGQLVIRKKRKEVQVFVRKCMDVLYNKVKR